MLPTAGRAAALLALGCALGLVVNAVRKDGVRPGSFAVATTCAATAPARSAVTVLPPTKAMTLCGDPGVLVADVRSPDRFARGHVAGAIHLPCGASGDVASRALGLLADKHTLIVYGDDTDEARPVAETLTSRLARKDIRVIILDGGFPAWDRAGLACSSGPCPECKEHAERAP
jgi:rhodanese-related sulfurtransferase